MGIINFKLPFVIIGKCNGYSAVPLLEIRQKIR